MGQVLHLIIETVSLGQKQLLNSVDHVFNKVSLSLAIYEAPLRKYFVQIPSYQIFKIVSIRVIIFQTIYNF